MSASLAARAKRSVRTPCDFDGAIDDRLPTMSARSLTFVSLTIESARADLHGRRPSLGTPLPSSA